MTSNFSLRTTVLVASILISGILIPVGVFASPMFETDTAETINSFFEPEQTISNPLYQIDADNEMSQISNLDVVVYDESEVYVVFQESTLGVSNVFLTITNSSIINVSNGYFIDSFNDTRTILLNENDWDTFGDEDFCNVATQPKIAVTDSHVFVAWRDQRDDSICNFGGPNSNRIAAIAIAKSSFNDLTSAFFEPLTSNGGTPPAYFDTGSLAEPFSLAANGTNAYIAWEDSDDTSVNLIRYFATNSTFSANQQLDTASTSKNPDVVADGANVYVAWQNGIADDKNIKLATSADFGITFGAEANISGTDSEISINPKLAEDNGIVHVSWLESVSGARQVFVASGPSYTPVGVSTISGTSSTSAQQIIADGSNVFTVWQDNINGGPSNEILFSRSVDSGDTWLNTPIDLSDSSGNSVLPKISGNSSHVNVVWRDNTFLPKDIPNDIDGQVWFKSSSDSGVSFGGLQVISESTNSTTNTFWAKDNGGTATNPAPVPNISSFGEIVVAVWNPDPSRGDFSNDEEWEGSMKVSTTSEIDISFNSTEYLSPRNATITVVDTSESGTVSIDLQRRDGSFEPYTLIEEGSSGTFSNTFELYNGTSNLDGAPGDIFTANYTTMSGSTITTQAKIQETRILDFLTEGNSTGKFTHDISDIVGLKLTDTGNIVIGGGIETIDVTVTSAADTSGITLTLTETGLDTGVFNMTNGLVFMNGTLTPSVGESITITIPNGTSNPGVIDTMREKITTTTNPAGIELTLTETGVNTKIYAGVITMCATSDAACIVSNIAAAPGDLISISNLAGSQVSNGIILPDDISDRGAILVSCGAISCGLVTATYNGLDVSINPIDIVAAGGGGGGVSRAGLVVNALAGVSSLSASGGGSDGSAPITSLGGLISNKNFDVPDEIVRIVESSDSTTVLAPISTSTFADFDMPLTINENGYPLGGFSNTIQTFSTDVGETVTISSLYYEQTALQHVSMYMNLRGITQGDLGQSDTQILYNKNKELVVIDPNGFFESVSVNIIEDEETIKKFAEFEIIFAKPLETSDIVLRSWDDRLRSMDTIIYDAIQVGIVDDTIVEETMDPEPVETPIQDDTPAVPDWVKNNAEWWSQGEVDDTTFKNAIGFLIEKQIIDIQIGPNVSINEDDLSPEELAELEDKHVIPIPDWVKNTAEWWYLGDLSQDEFLASIEYLVKEGIIEL